MKKVKKMYGLENHSYDHNESENVVKLEVTLTDESYEQFREMLETAEHEGQIEDVSVRIIQ